MKKLWILMVALIALVSCQAQPNPEEVLAAQAEALNAGDIDAVMALYTDDVVVKIDPPVPPGSPDTYTGKEEVRAWLEELAAMNFEMDIQVLDVDGETVTARLRTWVDPTRELGVAPLEFTEVCTIREGKIAGWTDSITDESMAKLMAAITPPLEQAIVGTWSWDTSSTYFQFKEDGTYRYHLYLDKLEQEPADVGQYQVEGTVLTFISGDESRVCKAGNRGSYEITITQEGKLELVLQQDECGTRRAPSRNPQRFTRVSP